MLEGVLSALTYLRLIRFTRRTRNPTGSVSGHKILRSAYEVAERRTLSSSPSNFPGQTLKTALSLMLVRGPRLP